MEEKSVLRLSCVKGPDTEAAHFPSMYKFAVCFPKVLGIKMRKEGSAKELF